MRASGPMGVALSVYLRGAPGGVLGASGLVVCAEFFAADTTIAVAIDRIEMRDQSWALAAWASSSEIA